MPSRARYLTVLALLGAPSLAVAQTIPTSSQEAAQGANPTATPTASPAPVTEGMRPAATVTPEPTASAAPTVATPALRSTPAPENIENRASPIVDLHGYIRTRFELDQSFTLGWGPQSVATTSVPYPGEHLPWYRSPDYTAQVCGTQPDFGMGALIARPGSCNNATQTSANMRLRLNPEIHPTEFMAVYSQIDILDNLVLGSTPEGYYVNGTRSSFAPITALNNTQIAPIFGYNSFTNSIVVKRAWAEITNPTLGQIRFGRMPSHWGLGILANAGNGYDSDHQSTVDRVMYTLRLRQSGLFGAVMWDFAGGGPTSASRQIEPGQTQAIDLSQFDDVHQWVASVGRRLEPEQARAAIARGEIVLNGGLYFVYRSQFLSNEGVAAAANGQLGAITSCTSAGYASTCGQGSVRRDANVFIPDLWLQLLARDFRLEIEAVYIRGSMRTSDIASGGNQGVTISQFGAALEAEYRTLNQRLTLGFRTGYASGDADTNRLTYQGGLPTQVGSDTTMSMFRFHPDYRVDLIFWRQIMQQVSGAYYFRPTVAYNFIDEPGGDLLFGRVDVIWSRASEFLQTRGHHADLGVEIDATVQYQSNHHRSDAGTPTPAPGFYANIQGGVFFPMAGMGPTDAERQTPTYANFPFETAFTVRAFMGVLF